MADVIKNKKALSETKTQLKRHEQTSQELDASFFEAQKGVHVKKAAGDQNYAGRLTMAPYQTGYTVQKGEAVPKRKAQKKKSREKDRSWRNQED